MIDVGIKIREYLINNEELNVVVSGNVYNQFVDDSNVNAPFLVVDIDSISVEDDVTGEEYIDIMFTINVLHTGYEEAIKLSQLIKTLLVADIQTDDYTIHTIKFNSFTELYNQNYYVNKITFKSKI